MLLVCAACVMDVCVNVILLLFFMAFKQSDSVLLVNQICSWFSCKGGWMLWSATSKSLAVIGII